MARVGAEEAERIAVAALLHIAGDEALLGRFVSVTGMDPGDMRAAAAERGFLAGVLDFLLGHEPDAAAFAAANSLDAETIMTAQGVLSGGGNDRVWDSI